MRSHSAPVFLVTCVFLVGCFGPGEFIDLNRFDTDSAADGGPDGGLVGEYITIQIDTSSSGANLGETLKEFPILVRLDEGNFDFSIVDGDGNDIVFTNANGDILPHEVEQWDADVNSAAIWILMDAVEAKKNNQTIRMYLHAPGADAGESAFPERAGFGGVYHLKEQGNNLLGGYRDSSDNRAAGSGVNMNATSQTAGVIGYGQRFDGTSYIDVPSLFGEPETVTLSCWFQPNDALGNILSLADSVLIRIDEMTGDLVGMFYDGETWRETRVPLDDISMPHHAAYTVDTDRHIQTLYIDGESTATSSYSGSIDYSIGYTSATIAVHANEDRLFFTGLVDEVRFETDARSADWIHLAYENQRQGGPPFVRIEQ